MVVGQRLSPSSECPEDSRAKAWSWLRIHNWSLKSNLRRSTLKSVNNQFNLAEFHVYICRNRESQEANIQTTSIIHYFVIQVCGNVVLEEKKIKFHINMGRSGFSYFCVKECV